MVSELAKKLITYIPIGLREKSFNIDLICSMKENGADMIELGLPFSDPVADGGVIQEANLISLNKGFKIKSSFELANSLEELDIDFVFMGYFNTFYKQGIEKFIQNSNRGCIIPDLPFEESQIYTPLFDKHNKALIQLIAPTTPIDRIQMLIENAKLFIYLVAYAGITGADNAKEESLSSIIDKIRLHTKTPIYLGFGITPENAKEKAQGVDGLIIGSYLVKILLDDNLSDVEKINKISNTCREIKEKIN